MEAISIHLSDEQGIHRKREVFQLGIPLARGELFPNTSVTLIDPGKSEELVCQSSPMANWPDGSIRWLKLQFLADLNPNQRRTIEFRARESFLQPTPPLSIEENHNGLAIDTGTAKFHLETHRPVWSHTENEEPVHHQLTLTNVEQRPCRAIADTDWEIIDHGAVSLSCELKGWFLDGNIQLLRFICKLTFYRNSKTIEVQACIHNPKRARHSGGLWDLGDSGSIHFYELTISASLSNIQKIKIVPEPKLPPIEISNGKCLLYQDSSGGENWKSLNHVNAKGEIIPRFRGYRLYVDNHIHLVGNRATPIITVKNSALTAQATLPRFWQNFPSSIGAYDSQLVVGLFPGEAAGAYELQGGERKTQTAYFHYGDNPNALAWTLTPAVPLLDAKQYEVSRAFPWFIAAARPGPIDELIRQGLDGPSNFFAKREVIDEFGWRNFGDIFADHETLYQQEDEPPLISHYNNQYDPIYGFARQFVFTGDKRWHELMDDLAAHVRDIDIYHTYEDRSEYNHGLFWHTDHYLPAHTATHRTFSKHNHTSSTPGQTGGGPAEEHCYSMGLLYHHFLTGDTNSKDAVIDLAQWITALHEGSNVLIEAFYKIKRYDLPKLISLLKGQPVTSHRYNLNRGTGNYLNTLIDAHILFPSKGWLTIAESVIRSTIHPDDDIHQRDLLAIEERWSYLVFLSSLSRYLLFKAEVDEFDDSYKYALESFCHYTRWMLQHENLFLKSSNQLEFPNFTWTAQDLRKATLFFHASFFDPEYRDQYLKKGQYFLENVIDSLSNTDERYFSRVQIILMQNYIHQNQDELLSTIILKNPNYINSRPALKLTILKILKRSSMRLAKAIRGFNLKKEVSWLRTRLGN